MTPTLKRRTFEAEPLRLPPQRLRAAEVDVWSLCADPAAPLPAGLHAILDAQEQALAARLVLAAHRPRRVLAHALKRMVLAAYLDTEPRALAFATAPYGKPHLRDGGLSFNLSHAHDAIVLAVAREQVVGVDVEHRRPLADRDGLVRRFFSRRERADFAAQPATQREAAFFRLWTRKEAYVKALGDGLRCPLDSFSVSLDEPARILEPVLPGWSLHHLQVAPGYVGALAVDHPAPRVRMRWLTLGGGRLAELPTAG